MCQDLTANDVYQHIHRPPTDIIADDVAFLHDMGIPTQGDPPLPIFAGIASIYP